MMVGVCGDARKVGVCAIGLRWLSSALDVVWLLGVAYCGEADVLFSGTATGACSPGLR